MTSEREKELSECTLVAAAAGVATLTLRVRSAQQRQQQQAISAAVCTLHMTCNRRERARQSVFASSYHMFRATGVMRDGQGVVFLAVAFDLAWTVGAASLDHASEGAAEVELDDSFLRFA